jgi:hypothetical protein
MEKALAVLIALALVFLGAFLAAAFLALPVMFFWDHSVVDVLHVPELDFSHAFSLVFLCNLLLKSSNSGGGAK